MRNPGSDDAPATDHTLAYDPAAPRPAEVPLTQRILQTRSGVMSINQLAQLIRASMRRSWKKGEQVRIETFLNDFPALQKNDAAILDLICSEAQLREEAGERPRPEEYAERFPALADQIQHQFALHEMLPADPAPASNTMPTPGDTLSPAAAAAAQTMKGPAVVGYDIQDELGRGGMGVVYKARHTRLNRTVALKMVLSGAHASGDELQRFRTEAESVASLQHPNIVQIYEVGDQAGLPFFSLEFIDGGSLADRLDASPNGLPPREAAAFVEKLALAMQAAHQRGIIHRDLKPANVLMTRDNEPKITDFGLAKRLDSTDGQTQSGSVMGTPSYMAPEQAAGNTREVGTLADVYSLGAILFELLTGRPPFESDSPYDTLRQVVEQDPTPPSQLRSGIPRDLETICLKCLQKQPRKRYASAQELADDLHRFLKHVPIEARRIGAIERTIKWARRRPATATLIAVVILSLFTLAGFGASYHFEIEKALKETKAQKDIAEGEKRSADERLVRLTVISGTQEVDAGDLLGALPWFARALRLEQGNPDRAELHRVRLGSVLHQSPKLRQMWFHDHRVTSAAYSPDGKKVLTTCGDGTARLWDAASGEPIGQPIRHPDIVLAGAFSPKSDRILTVCQDGVVRVADATTGKPLAKMLGHRGAIHHAEFSPDGSKIVTASADGTARVWDAATGNQPFLQPLKHAGPVRHAAFSADGARIATASDDKTAQVWDAATGDARGPALKHGDRVLHAAFGPLNERVVTSCADGTARIWLVKIGKSPTPALRHTAPIVYSAWSPDGQHVVTAGQDNRAQLWRIATGERVGAPMKHGSDVTRATFSPDGKYLATASDDNTARVWDAATGEPISPPLKHNGSVFTAVFHPTDKHLLTASSDGTARVWIAGTNEVLGPALDHAAPVRAAAISPDGKLALTAAEDGRAHLWDASTGKQLMPALTHRGEINSAIFSPDGSRILTASTDKTAQVWDATTRLPVGKSLAHDGPVRSAVFSADGLRVATASADGRARVWRADTGEKVAEFSGHKGAVNSVAFSPDGHRAITAGADGTAQLWAIADPSQKPLKFQHSDEVLHAGFSPDGQKIVTASADQKGHVWDVDTRRKIGSPLQHSSRVNHASFDPTGQRVVTSSDDNTARVWEAATGKPLIPPLRHGGSVSRAAWGPHGHRLLTCSEDNTARVWDARTGEPLTPPLPHGAGVADAQFNPDGSRVITASADRTARLWNFPPDPRPIEDLENLASLLGGGTIDATGGFVPLTPEALRAAWQSVRGKIEQPR